MRRTEQRGDSAGLTKCMTVLMRENKGHLFMQIVSKLWTEQKRSHRNYDRFHDAGILRNVFTGCDEQEKKRRRVEKPF